MWNSRNVVIAIQDKGGDFVTQHSQRANTHLEADRKPSSRISNGDHKAWNPSEVTKLHEPGGKAVISIPALG